MEVNENKIMNSYITKSVEDIKRAVDETNYEFVTAFMKIEPYYKLKFIVVVRVADDFNDDNLKKIYEKIINIENSCKNLEFQLLTIEKDKDYNKEEIITDGYIFEYLGK